MKLKKFIVLTSLLLLLFLSIGMASANENTTIASEGIQDKLMDTSNNYNAEISVYNINNRDSFMDTYVKVCDKNNERIDDANVYMNDNRTADLIDENKDYHFYLYENGEYTFTLDDGVYKAQPFTFKLNAFPSNATKDPLRDYNDENDSISKTKLTLVSDNFTINYGDLTSEIVVWALDEDDDHICGLNILMDDQYSPDYDDEDGYTFSIDYLPAGTHVFEISLDDEEYVADPIHVEVNVLKSTPIITAKKWYSTQNQYVTLKAEVSDEWDANWVDEGTVTFKINGKSYTVDVKDGKAIKKVKISKSGTYKYTATFKSSNHHTRTASGKVYVYSTSKKARTFDVKGYKIVVPVNKYNKLVNAKNTRKGVFYEINTNKFIKQTYRHYYSGNKYVYKTVKARGVICISFGGKNGLQTAPPNKYSLYLFTRYQGPDSFCTPSIGGQKISTEINKLNKAKTVSR